MDLKPEIIEFFMNENKDGIIHDLQRNILYNKIRKDGYNVQEFWVQVEKRKEEMKEFTISPEDIHREAIRRLENDLMEWMVKYLGFMYTFYTQPDSIQNLKNMGGIVRHILDHTEIDYIQYQDQKYTDCGEEDPCWCSLTHYEEDEEEEDEEEGEKEIKIKKIQPPSHEIKYHIKMPWEDKRVFFFDKVILKNISGFNRDARGSDNLDIILDFNPTYVLKGNKLSDFVEGIYRVKSHKFDTWYELMDKAYCKVNGEELTIFLEFNHGS